MSPAHGLVQYTDWQYLGTPTCHSWASLAYPLGIYCLPPATGRNSKWLELPVATLGSKELYSYLVRKNIPVYRTNYATMSRYRGKGRHHGTD